MHDRLKELRLNKGYKLIEMSRVLGYSSPNAYLRKENGERKFNLDEVYKISRLFELSVEEIFFNNELPDMGNGQNFKETG